MNLTAQDIIQSCTVDLPEKPAFRFFRYRDWNPISRRFKIRVIGAPNESMRKLHDRFGVLLVQLEKNVDFSNTTGFRKHCTAIANVRRHASNRHFYLTDIHDAYGSIDGQRLAQVLGNLIVSQRDMHGNLSALLEESDGGSQNLYSFLKKYFLSKKGGLVVGAPMSPALFNIYTAVLLDVPLRRYCSHHNITYSRYADDLTFSTRDVRIGNKKRKHIRALVQAAGLTVSHRKSEVVSLKRDQAIFINGIGLRYSGQMFLPRRYLGKIRGFMHHIHREQQAGATQGDNIELKPETLKKLERLTGMMASLRQTTDNRVGMLNRCGQNALRKYRLLRHAFKLRTRLNGSSIKRKKRKS
jgi:hypothetical protein